MPRSSQTSPPIRGRRRDRSARSLHAGAGRRRPAQGSLRTGAMKVIMPMAGKGTRLLPLTKRVPKPLVNVAGRPVMDYVMDALKRAGKLDELIIITGHLKEKVEAYVRENYDIPARFIEQKVLDGTAGAGNLARPYVDGPVLGIFAGTLFDADLSIERNTEADGLTWNKEVKDEPRRAGLLT